ncbi:hypothetical protein EJB05_03353, partial [Eragrostis curvula]
YWYVHLRALLLNRTVQPGTPDVYVWRWTADGVYSAKSAYAMLNQGGERFQCSSRIWDSWAPLKVKLFIWLASRRRVWTADRRRRHGLPAAPRCCLCDQEPESCDHLLVSCSFAKEEIGGQQPGRRRKGFNTMFMLTAWSIWKERNARVFDGKASTAAQVVQRIKSDAELWAQGGAKELGRLCWE